MRVNAHLLRFRPDGLSNTCKASSCRYEITAHKGIDDDIDAAPLTPETTTKISKAQWLGMEMRGPQLQGPNARTDTIHAPSGVLDV